MKRTSVLFPVAAAALFQASVQQAHRAYAQDDEGQAVAQQTASPAAPSWLPDSVILTADLPYAGTDNPRQQLDLLLPNSNGERPLPVIAFVHGGAWLGGDKRAGLRRLAPFVATGRYAGVSIGYRLSGESIWPTQIHDCKAAIRWIRAHAATHGLDADRIAVWGDSAGGHLVAMLGTSGDVDAMDGRLGPQAEVSSRVACVVDFFGPTDFLRMNETAMEGAALDHDAPDSPESKLVGGAIQDHPDKVAAANPMTYATSDDPPFLIVHGTRDPLVAFNQSELLHEALRRTGVQSTLITVDGAGHGSGFGPDVSNLVGQFFAHHLRNQRAKWEDQTLKAATQPSRR